MAAMATNRKSTSRVEDTEANLKPTLWRTARALANSQRLKLFRLIVEEKGPIGVVELAKKERLAVPTASAYLRALNARGIVGVERKGAFVFYNLRTDRSLPVAIAIQKALLAFFRSNVLSDDWASRLVPVFRAFAHPRRLLLIDILRTVPDLDETGFLERSGFCSTTLRRHLNVLLRSGVIWRSNHDTYFLPHTPHPWKHLRRAGG